MAPSLRSNVAVSCSSSFPPPAPSLVVRVALLDVFGTFVTMPGMITGASLSRPPRKPDQLVQVLQDLGSPALRRTRRKRNSNREGRRLASSTRTSLKTNSSWPRSPKRGRQPKCNQTQNAKWTQSRRPTANQCSYSAKTGLS